MSRVILQGSRKSNHTRQDLQVVPIFYAEEIWLKWSSEIEDGMLGKRAGREGWGMCCGEHGALVCFDASEEEEGRWC